VKPRPVLTWPAATAAVNETVRWDRDERLFTRRCCATVGAGPTRSIRQLKARVLGHQAIRITGRSAHAPPRLTEPARQRATRAPGSDAIPPFPAIHGNHTRTTKHATLVMFGILHKWGARTTNLLETFATSMHDRRSDVDQHEAMGARSVHGFLCAQHSGGDNRARRWAHGSAPGKEAQLICMNMHHLFCEHVPPTLNPKP
jgi:hypothetical protein